jgi:probable phosphoglycerate mutase
MVPAVPSRLLLVRHGQSAWNALGRWQGQADPPLSELGELQAAHAANRLGSIDAVIASDLVRARHTADLIAERLGIGPVLVDPDLRERDAGEWCGLTREEIESQWPGYLARGDRPPAFESDQQFRARALAALGRAGQAAPGGSILVVAHAGVVYQVEEHLGAPFERLPNLAGRWLTVDADGGLELGDRVVLVEPDEITVPGSL